MRFLEGGDFSAESENGVLFPYARELESPLRAAVPEGAVSETLLLELERYAGWIASAGGAKTAAAEQTPLCAVLEEVRRQSDYRTAKEPGPEWAAFWRRWKEQYPMPQTFRITGAGQINEVNLSEAGDYLDAHLKTAGEVSYMKHAVDSLLAALPGDTETILDIGSGPGYVNERLPADLSILAMDIDEDILRGNTRQTCLGDIMDIPLEDRSVDLVMACDMLEHLPDEVLKKGAAELERVSDKYIYLQVPFQEDPLLAFAHCPQCGNVWHVNHHKRSFDEKGLRSVLSGDWEPVLINYTGDVSYRRNGQTAAMLAEKLGWKVYGVEGAVCPDCGAESKAYGQSDLKLMQRLADYDTASPFPVYSEIGILFCRAEAGAKLPASDRLVRYRKESRGALPVKADFKPQAVFTRTELLPALYLSGCRLAEAGESLRLERQADAELAWVAVAFPPLREQGNASLRIVGRLNEPGEVKVGLLDDAGTEHYAQSWNWDDRDTVHQLPLPGKKSVNPVFVKLYFGTDELVLNDCRLQGKEQSFLFDYLHEKPSFLSFREAGTEIRLYAPAGEDLLLSHSPTEWRRLTNDVPCRLEKATQRFAHDLQEAARAGSDGGDNRRLIAQLLMRDPTAATGTRLLPEKLDNRYLITDLLVSSAVASPSLTTESDRHQTGKAGNRVIIAVSLYVEAELLVYRESGRTGLRKKIRRKLIGFLKRRKDRLHAWLHRHEPLYEFLISLGLKDVYQKLKRRILQ